MVLKAVYYRECGNSGVCKAGDTWQKECNTCICTSQGTQVCTEKSCNTGCLPDSGLKVLLLFFLCFPNQVADYCLFVLMFTNMCLEYPNLIDNFKVDFRKKLVENIWPKRSTLITGTF